MALPRTPPSSTCTTRTVHPYPVGGASARPGRSTSQVHRSLISHGCVINGTVVNSVLCRASGSRSGGRPRLDRRSTRSSAPVVDRAILDKEVVVGPGRSSATGSTSRRRTVGAGPALHRHHVIGKRAIISAASHRPQREDRRRRPASDFATRVVRSGATVEHHDHPPARSRARRPERRRDIGRRERHERCQTGPTRSAPGPSGRAPSARAPRHRPGAVAPTEAPRPSAADPSSGPRGDRATVAPGDRGGGLR